MTICDINLSQGEDQQHTIDYQSSWPTATKSLKLIPFRWNICTDWRWSAIQFAGDEHVDLLQKCEILGSVLAPDIPQRLLLGVAPEPHLAAPAPHPGGVAAVGKVRLCPEVGGAEGDAEGEPLVVAAGDALQVVEAGEGAGGDGVELAGGGVAGAGEVEEEGDAVGSADEGVGLGGGAGADEGGVAGADQVLEQPVVGEAALERAVGEDQRPLLAGLRLRRRFGDHRRKSPDGEE